MIHDYVARCLLAALSTATAEDLADPLKFGPWTRGTYREIGVDLGEPDWRAALEDAQERFDA